MTPAPLKIPPRAREVRKAKNRLQIIEATIDSIALYGYARTTVSTIIARAGVSRGMVNLHFESMETLFLEVLRHLAERYRENWEGALAAAGPDPAARLTAMIESDLGREVLSHRAMAVWFAFRAEAKAHPEYLELYETRDRDYSRTMRGLCRELAGGRGPDPEMVADGLYAMIEGLWIDFLLHPDDFDQIRSKQICLSYLAAQFPGKFKPAAGR